MTTYFLTLRGTGEKHRDPTSMFGIISQDIGDATWVDVDYPASVGPANETNDAFGTSLEESVTQAIRNLAQVITNLVGVDGEATFILGGYSLGALAIQRFLYVALPPLLEHRFLRTVLIANPLRPHGDSYMREDFGHGIAGEASVQVSGLYNIANPADAITSLHPKSPIRNLVPWVYALDLNEPRAWLESILQEAQQKSLIQAPVRFLDREWLDAVARMPGDLYGYALGGNHTLAYSEKKWDNGLSGIEVAQMLVKTA